MDAPPPPPPTSAPGDQEVKPSTMNPSPGSQQQTGGPPNNNDISLLTDEMGEDLPLNDPLVNSTMSMTQADDALKLLDMSEGNLEDTPDSPNVLDDTLISPGRMAELLEPTKTPEPPSKSPELPPYSPGDESWLAGRGIPDRDVTEVKGFQDFGHPNVPVSDPDVSRYEINQQDPFDTPQKVQTTAMNRSSDEDDYEVIRKGDVSSLMSVDSPQPGMTREAYTSGLSDLVMDQPLHGRPSMPPPSPPSSGTTKSQGGGGSPEQQPDLPVSGGAGVPLSAQVKKDTSSSSAAERLPTPSTKSTTITEKKPAAAATTTTHRKQESIAKMADSSSSSKCPYNPVADLVYWKDPRKSGAVFGAGLLILFSLACCSVISVAAYTALTILFGTLSFRIYKSILQAVQKTNEGHPFKEYLEIEITPPADKVHKFVDSGLKHVNAVVNKLRAVFLVEDIIDSIKYLVIFWCLTYVGSWFNGLTLIILTYLACFSLPKVYEMHKEQVDSAIEMAHKQVTDVVNMVKSKLPFPVAGGKDKTN